MRCAVEMSYDAVFWAAALLLLGGGLRFVPLFDTLGHEWSLALGVAAAFAGAQLSAAATIPAPHRKGWYWRGCTHVSSMCVWLMLLPPLLAIVANALRRRNCDESLSINSWWLLSESN
jgi:UPF0716 family protein affecting phage T7 exclusion